MAASTAYGVNELYSTTRTARRPIFDGVGALTEVPGLNLGLTFDPATLTAKGLLIEPTTQNYVRNPRAEGATLGVIGNGGVAPTNWLIAGSATPVNREIVSIGTENGIPYIDLRFSSAGITGGAVMDIVSEATNPMPTVIGDTVCGSAYVRLLAGAIPGDGRLFHTFLGYNASLANVSTTGVTGFTLTNAPLNQQRVQSSATMTHADTAFTRYSIRRTLAVGDIFDFTIRVGATQFEKATPWANFPLLPLVGSPALVTRGADTVRLDMTKVGFANIGSTLIISFTPHGFPISTGGIFRLDDGSDNNALIFYHQSAGQLRCASRVDGVETDRPVGNAVLTIGQEMTIRATFGPNLFRTSWDGVNVHSHAMVGYPLNLNRCYVGAQWVGGGRPCMGTFRRLDIIPRTVSDAELPTISA